MEPGPSTEIARQDKAGGRERSSSDPQSTDGGAEERRGEAGPALTH